MTTIRVARRARWTTIHRDTANDERLSFRARGVLLWLLDKPDDWSTDSERIADAGTEGRDAIRTALTELEALGYLTRTKEQGDGGRWSTIWTIRERPTVGEPGPLPRPDDRGLRTETHNATPEVASGSLPTPWVGSGPLGWTPSRVALDGGHLAAAVALAEHFGVLLTSRGVRVPPGRPRSKGWVEPIEAMLRIDGRTPEQIRTVIGWLHAGRDRTAAFWQANVLSPDKLRLRWDQMAQQYRRETRTVDRNAAVLDDGSDIGDVLAARRSS